MTRRLALVKVQRLAVTGSKGFTPSGVVSCFSDRPALTVRVGGKRGRPITASIMTRVATMRIVGDPIVKRKQQQVKRNGLAKQQEACGLATQWASAQMYLPRNKRDSRCQPPTGPREHGMKVVQWMLWTMLAAHSAPGLSLNA